jgi:serine/threonine protein kinase
MSEHQVIGGRFEIGDLARDLLGRGGVGDVYRGTDQQTGQPVAIKVLRPEVVSGTPDAIARFRREGEALRELDHHNIVKMVDAVEDADAGRHYLVMEYVPGGSLRDLLEVQGRLPVERTVEIALEVADALTRAHHLGIIHRDLKPSNVLLAEDGTPRLTDFGIAQLASGPRLTGADRAVGTVEELLAELEG